MNRDRSRLEWARQEDHEPAFALVKMEMSIGSPSGDVGGGGVYGRRGGPS